MWCRTSWQTWQERATPASQSQNPLLLQLRQYLYFGTSKASKLSTEHVFLWRLLYFRQTLGNSLSLISSIRVSAYSRYSRAPLLIFKGSSILSAYSRYLRAPLLIFKGSSILSAYWIREKSHCTILPLDSRNQESAQIPGFWNPMVKWCNGIFLWS